MKNPFVRLNNKNWLLDGYQRNLGAVIFGIGVWMFYATVSGAVEVLLCGVTIIMGGSVDSALKTFKKRRGQLTTNN